MKMRIGEERCTKNGMKIKRFKKGVRITGKCSDLSGTARKKRKKRKRR